MASEVYRTLCGEANFSPWYREHSVLIDDVMDKTIVDIELRFWASPTLQPTNPGAAFVGVQDMRLYMCGQDVTAALILELQALVQNIPVSVIRQRYQDGANSYLAFIRSFPSSAPLVANDDAIVTAIAADPNWAAKFSTLGDRSQGWSGNLHPLNFLFRFIPMIPISLAKVWARYIAQSHSPLPADMSNLTLPLSIVLSEGVSPSVGSIDSSFIPGGCVRYQLDIKSQNPLLAQLNLVLSKLHDLQITMSTLQLNYLGPLDAQMAALNTELQAGDAALTASLNRLTTTVNNIA